MAETEGCHASVGRSVCLSLGRAKITASISTNIGREIKETMRMMPASSKDFVMNSFSVFEYANALKLKE